MPVFRYTAMDRAGRTVRDQQEAPSEAVLSKALHGSGLFLMEAVAVERAAPAPQAAAAPEDRKAIPLKDVVDFTSQFALMVRAALPALEAIETLAGIQENPDFKALLKSALERLQRGEALSDVFELYPEAFDSVYLSLLRAGEASGKMVIMLTRIGEYLRFKMELRARVRTAMIYPTLVLGASVAVILFLMMFVLPTFVEIFSQFDAELPLATRGLLGASMILRDYWPLFLIAAGFAYWYARRWYRVAANRRRAQIFSLSVPIMGPLIRSVVLTRVLRTMALLLEGGVPILAALELTRAAASHAYFEDVLTMVIDRVSEGKGLASGFHKAEFFPGPVAHMIATAERTGTLGEVLKASADHYEAELDTAFRNAFAAIEPLFIGILSGFVALIAICILQPILGMGGLVGE